MGIKHWPQDERPREKLQRLGAACLSDAELLAILLRVGVAGQDVLSLSRELLQHYGSLNALFKADEEDLLSHKGVGMAAFCQLSVVLELGKRVCAQQKIAQPVRALADIEDLLQAYLAHESVEVLLALWLNSNNVLLGVDPISRGSLSHHTVYIRELAKLALQKHAAALILAHNHPSGSLLPSEEDKRHTQSLQDALALLDIRLLDHIIVARGQCVSLMHV